MSAIPPNLLDGDLIAVRSKSDSIFPELTRLITRSPYTHTAVVIKLDGLEWLAEMEGAGNQLVPFDRYSDEPFDIFDYPGDRSLIRANTLESLDGRIPYGLVDLLRIAAFNLLHLKLPRTDTGGMVCSAYSAWLWKGAGVQLDPGMPSIPSPAALVAAIGKPPKFSFDGG